MPSVTRTSDSRCDIFWIKTLLFCTQGGQLNLATRCKKEETNKQYCCKIHADVSNRDRSGVFVRGRIIKSSCQWPLFAYVNGVGAAELEVTCLIPAAFWCWRDVRKRSCAVRWVHVQERQLVTLNPESHITACVIIMSRLRHLKRQFVVCLYPRYLRVFRTSIIFHSHPN